MKALLLTDEINQFHWSMLKSVLLILSYLPSAKALCIYGKAPRAVAKLWWASLQLVLMSSLLALSFWSALKATVAKLKQEHALRH